MTREERRRRSREISLVLTALCFLVLFLIALLVPVKRPAEPLPEDGSIPGDDVPATDRCYMTAEEIAAEHQTYTCYREDLNAMAQVDGVQVTFYCVEPYRHICGTGTGKTFSGTPVKAYETVATDPALIPTGSAVLVDYGDGVLHEYRADDRGAAVKGKHIDVAVESHEQALQLGTTTAKVWWTA